MSDNSRHPLPPLTPTPTPAVERWGLTIATVVMLGVFIGKPFHIDDPLFLWTAHQIQSHPENFYGFSVNWYGSDMPMSLVTKNPPIASYYIAATAWGLGWSEPAIHAPFLLVAVATVLGVYELGRRFSTRPWMVAWLCLVSPVFFVSATTVMSDLLMLCGWVWAVILWIRGLDRRCTPDLLAASVLIAIAALTKYFAMSLIPLLAVYTMHRGWRDRDVGGAARRVAFLLIPIGLLAAYQGYTQRVYGIGLLLDAATYAQTAQKSWGTRLPAVLAFVGGCLLPAGLASLALLSRRQVIAWLVVFLCALSVGGGVAAAGQLRNAPGNVLSVGSGLQLGFWATLGACLLVSIGNSSCNTREPTAGNGVKSASCDWQKFPDPEAMLLLLWVLGTLFFAGIVNWSLNGRSILPAVPAIAILVARKRDYFDWRSSTGKSPESEIPLRSALQVVALMIGAAASLLIAYGDFRHAVTARQAAYKIMASLQDGKRQIYFQGHWGFQYYMEQLGARALTLDHIELHQGDVLVVPNYNTNVMPLSAQASVTASLLEIPVNSIIGTCRGSIGAGFYDAALGPLPFALSWVEPDRYLVFLVTQNIIQP